MSTNVYIRKRAKKGNKLSIYLDFYPAVILPGTKKATRRKSLGLWEYAKPKSTEEREHNRQQKQLAEQWKAKFLNMVQEKVFFSEIERELYERKEIEKTSFKEFFHEQTEIRSGKTKEQWQTTYNLFNIFRPYDVSFSDITVEFIEEFKEFIFKQPSRLSPGQSIHQNTAKTYFKPFRVTLNIAHRYDRLSKDFNKTVPDIPMLDTKREFLTLDELVRLKATPCEDNEIRGAAFFSIYTGLRFSDVKSLVWDNVKLGDGGMYLEFRQRKTKGLEQIPISDDVIELLGEPKSSNELIFPNLGKKKGYNSVIKRWISDAGIHKKITFHCFRHTNATLLISKGVDLYTVSKILGHRNIKTTQIYAKVVDESKRNAINLIRF